MKKRSYTLMTYALAILLGAALFLTSERVQRAERVYDNIQEKLTTEREAYHILETEWTYLNRPDRLEDLAATHLKLAPLKPDTTLTTAVNLPTMAETTSSKIQEQPILSVQDLNSVSPSSNGIITISTPAHASLSSLPTSLSKKTIYESIKNKIVKPTPKRRNTSTAGVTFYQYMNRGHTLKSSGELR